MPSVAVPYNSLVNWLGLMHKSLAIAPNELEPKVEVILSQWPYFFCK